MKEDLDFLIESMKRQWAEEDRLREKHSSRLMWGLVFLWAGFWALFVAGAVIWRLYS